MLREKASRSVKKLGKVLDDLELSRNGIKERVKGTWTRTAEGSEAVLVWNEGLGMIPRQGDKVLDGKEGWELLVLDVEGYDKVSYLCECGTPLPLRGRAAGPEFSVVVNGSHPARTAVVTAQESSRHRCRVSRSLTSYWFNTVTRDASVFVIRNLPDGPLRFGLTGIGEDGTHTEETVMVVA